MRKTHLLILLVLALYLAGCGVLGALTPRGATRQSLQRLELDQQGASVLGDYRLPNRKSLVIFSFTPAPENGKPMTGLGHSLLERTRLGIWSEVNRGTFTKEALDLGGDTIDYEIANQPGEVAAVFGRVVGTKVGEVVAVYDDGHETRDKRPKNGFAFFAGQGAYPVMLRTVGKDGKVLETIELTLTESVAMETLGQFFSYLHDEMYAEAVQLYGGSYQELADMNPTINPTDYAALWENACKVNGFQCLYLESIGPKGKTAPAGYAFLVGFMDEEGNTFRQENCCGESGTAAQEEYEYNVQKAQDGQFKVMDLPVYVP